MKTKAAASGFLAFLLIGAFGLEALAEETTPPPAPAAVEEPAEDEELEYTFGVVKSAGADQITINEFDYDTGEEKEITYAIDPQVELNNAVTVAEIAPGDEVDIDYRLEGDKKIAMVISVAKPLPVETPGGES